MRGIAGVRDKRGALAYQRSQRTVARNSRIGDDHGRQTIRNGAKANFETKRLSAISACVGIASEGDLHRPIARHHLDALNEGQRGNSRDLLEVGYIGAVDEKIAK